MNREYLRWYSPALQRDMELLVFGHGGSRVVVFPTRCGRFHEYEDFGLVRTIADRIEQGWLQLFCVDSVDAESFYCRGRAPRDRIVRHMAYERYILDEVIPFSESKSPGSFLMTHGASLGAFQAVNIALRHPTVIRKVVAFSGRYDLTVGVEDFADMFDGYFDEDIYYHSPNRFVPNIHDPALLQALRRLEVVLTVGAEDPFLSSNRELAAHLSAQSIPHALHVWDGRAHSKRHWTKMCQLYL
ncbi:MAG: alpha/beta hydrolase-fold protein [Polyangiaceae bacterium]|nr:alpha/beta hydrolase-fold protein [Polyangiaceae bacterium]